MNVTNQPGKNGANNANNATDSSGSTPTPPTKNGSKPSHNRPPPFTPSMRMNSNSQTMKQMNKTETPDATATTIYENIRLHDVSGTLTLTQDRIVFRPLDKQDKEHYFGWSWESLEKHVISALPPSNNKKKKKHKMKNDPSFSSESDSNTNTSNNSNTNSTATPTTTTTPTFDDCFLKLVSFADPHKTVAFLLPDRVELNRIHQDISSRMHALRKYRKVKEALLETKAKYKHANQTIDELQDQNSLLLKNFETAAKKATQLQEVYDQLKNEKTALAIEYEMDQQEWKQQRDKMQQEIEQLRRRCRPPEELELEISLLAKALMAEKAKNLDLQDRLTQQEMEYEALLWEVRTQRNNVMLELRHTQNQKEHKENVLALPSFEIQPQPSNQQQQKVSLSQSALYGSLIQSLFDPSRNQLCSADLSKYYEHIFQVATGSHFSGQLLQQNVEEMLNVGHTSITTPLPSRSNHPEAFHNNSLPTTTTPTKTIRQDELNVINNADSSSLYSIVGYCTVDCRVISSGGAQAKNNKESDMQIQWVSSSSHRTLSEDDVVEKLPKATFGSPASTYYYDASKLDEPVVECLPSDNTKGVVHSVGVGDSYINNISTTTTTNDQDPRIDFQIRDVCRYERYDTGMAWKLRYCNPARALEDTVAVWMKQASANTTTTTTMLSSQ